MSAERLRVARLVLRNLLLLGILGMLLVQLGGRGRRSVATEV